MSSTKTNGKAKVESVTQKFRYFSTQTEAIDHIVEHLTARGMDGEEARGMAHDVLSRASTSAWRGEFLEVEGLVVRATPMGYSVGANR